MCGLDLGVFYKIWKAGCLEFFSRRGGLVGGLGVCNSVFENFCGSVNP